MLGTFCLLLSISLMFLNLDFEVQGISHKGRSTSFSQAEPDFLTESPSMRGEPVQKDGSLGKVNVDYRAPPQRETVT